MLEDLNQFRRVALPSEAGLEQAIAAGGTIGVEAEKLGDRRMRLTRRYCGGDAGRGRVLMQRMTDRNDRGMMASAHARCPRHANTGAEPVLQIGKKPR